MTIDEIKQKCIHEEYTNDEFDKKLKTLNQKTCRVREANCYPSWYIWDEPIQGLEIEHNGPYDFDIKKNDIIFGYARLCPKNFIIKYPQTSYGYGELLYDFHFKDETDKICFDSVEEQKYFLNKMAEVINKRIKKEDEIRKKLKTDFDKWTYFCLISQDYDFDFDHVITENEVQSIIRKFRKTKMFFSEMAYKDIYQLEKKKNELFLNALENFTSLVWVFGWIDTIKILGTNIIRYILQRKEEIDIFDNNKFYYDISFVSLASEILEKQFPALKKIVLENKNDDEQKIIRKISNLLI